MREYPSRPLIGIGVVVIRQRDVLLVRRMNPPREGEWSIPGGLQRIGETVFQAACREVFEEAALVIRPQALVDVVDLIEIDSESKSIHYHYTLIEILATWESGELRAGSDALDAGWIKITDLEDYVRWPETTRIIRKAHHLATGGSGVSEQRAVSDPA